MPRIRTNPETLAVATRDQVRGIMLEIPHSGETGKPLPDVVQLTYIIQSTDDNHASLKEVRESIAWADLPVAVRDDLKSLYSKIIIDAENKGHIGAGTDEDDLA